MSIIHRFSHKACVHVKKWSVEGYQSGNEIISTSCTRSDVRSWFSFLMTYNHKTNHQGGSDLWRTLVSNHKVISKETNLLQFKHKLYEQIPLHAGVFPKSKLIIDPFEVLEVI